MSTDFQLFQQRHFKTILKMETGASRLDDWFSEKASILSIDEEEEERPTRNPYKEQSRIVDWPIFGNDRVVAGLDSPEQSSIYLQN